MFRFASRKQAFQLEDERNLVMMPFYGLVSSKIRRQARKFGLQPVFGLVKKLKQWLHALLKSLLGCEPHEFIKSLVPVGWYT